MQILTELPIIDSIGKFSKDKVESKIIMTHDELLKQELIEFYTNTEYLNRMSAIINGKRLSLRLLDWFVCNYSKEYFTIYMIPRGTIQSRFIVYIDYKTNLDIYSKKRFAPFCRHERVYVPYDEDNYMETTIGQLNFFRWVFKNHILEYIEAHYDEIKRDMDARNTSRKRRNISGTSDSSLESNTEPITLSNTEPKLLLENMDSSVEDKPLINMTNDDITTEWVSPSYPLGTISVNLSSKDGVSKTKTRKKREELSHSACRSMRLEKANITIHFGSS